MGLVHELLRGFRAWHGTAIDIKWEREQGKLMRAKWRGLGLRLKEDSENWATACEFAAKKEQKYQSDLTFSRGAAGRMVLATRVLGAWRAAVREARLKEDAKSEIISRMLVQKSRRRVALDRQNLVDVLDQVADERAELVRAREADTADRELLSAQHAAQLEQLMQMRDEMDRLRAENEAMAQVKEENTRLRGMVVANERSDVGTTAGIARLLETALGESDAELQSQESSSGSASDTNAMSPRSPQAQARGNNMQLLATPAVAEATDAGPSLLRVARTSSDLKATAAVWTPTRGLGQHYARPQSHA